MKPIIRDTQHTMPVANIRIGKRHRHDLGDITGLAATIAELGLLHPIVVKPDGSLIAGERRLQACQQLGWTDIPVTVVDIADIVRGEHAENAHRKDFLPSEIASIVRELEPIEKAAAKERQGTRNDLVESFHNVNGGKTRDKIAAFTGVSGRTLDKIKAVVEAAEKEPERFGRLLEKMDATGKIEKSYAELRRVQVEESDAVPITGAVDARIITGDFRIEGHAIEDNSVDLIFTDPPYHREFIPQYADLAKFAARVLVPGGSLITYVGHYALFEIGALMLPHLQYHWINALVHDGTVGNRILWGKHLHVGWKPLLWFTKGPRRTNIVVADCLKCSPGNKAVDHEWAQGTKGPDYYIEHLSRKNALVIDPYLGGGTTGVSALRLGRRFVGFEINPDTARNAEARIAKAGPSEDDSGEAA
jgi:hypothetical protein